MSTSWHNLQRTSWQKLGLPSPTSSSGLASLLLFFIVSQATLEPIYATTAPLILQPPHADRNTKLKYGQSACVSSDGKRLLLGASSFNNFRGAVYIYDLIGRRAGTRIDHWHHTCVSPDELHPAEERRPNEFRPLGRGSSFGLSCFLPLGAIAHDVAIVGAPGHNVQRGAVFILRLTGGEWRVDDMLHVPDSRVADMFGWAVAADAECKTVVVGAKGRAANDGEVSVFTCEPSCRVCKRSARLRAPDRTDGVGPRGIRIRNNFGTALAISQDSATIVVGSTGYHDERGIAYVFERRKEGAAESANVPADSEAWELTERLLAQNDVPFAFFGFKIAVNADASLVAVGADGEDDYRGAVYVFHRNSNSSDKTTVDTLLAEVREKEDNFGGSLALAAAKNVLFVGAPGMQHAGHVDHGELLIHEYINGKWLVAERHTLPHSHARGNAFFAWDVAVSPDARRFVATSPDWGGGSGLAAVGTFEVAGKRAADSSSLARDDILWDKTEL